MNRSFGIRRLVWTLGPAIAVLAIGCASGCYERVVRAEGLGAQGVAVQKPYRSETSLDKAFDGTGGGFGSSSSGSSVSTPTAPRAPR